MLHGTETEPLGFNFDIYSWGPHYCNTRVTYLETYPYVMLTCDVTENLVNAMLLIIDTLVSSGTVGSDISGYESVAFYSQKVTKVILK